MAVKKKAANSKIVVTVATNEDLQSGVDDVQKADAIVKSPAAVEPARLVANAPRFARYLLPSRMEIADLGPVHADLLAISSGNDGPFVLDGSELNVIDAAGLQMLVSFIRSVCADGKKISWENYSVHAYQLADELGLVEQLGD